MPYYRGVCVCIFRSTGLGLEGTISHLWVPVGSHGRVSSALTELQAPLLLNSSSHVLLAHVAPVGQAACCTPSCGAAGVSSPGGGRGYAHFMRTSPGTVWQCLT